MYLYTLLHNNNNNKEKKMLKVIINVKEKKIITIFPDNSIIWNELDCYCFLDQDYMVFMQDNQCNVIYCGMAESRIVPGKFLQEIIKIILDK